MPHGAAISPCAPSPACVCIPPLWILPWSMHIHNVSGQTRASGSSICPLDTYHSGMGDLIAICRRAHPRPPRRRGRPTGRPVARHTTARPVATAGAGAATAADGPSRSARCRHRRAAPGGPPAGCPAPLRSPPRSRDQCDVLLTCLRRPAGGVVAPMGESTVASKVSPCRRHPARKCAGPYRAERVIKPIRVRSGFY